MAKKKQPKVTRKKVSKQSAKPTKKAAKRRAPASRQSRQPRSANAVEPLTLDEALAIVRGGGSGRPRRNLLRPEAESAEALPVAPTTVEMRVELKKQQHAEVEQRIKEYAETMALMKERGVRGMEPEVAVANVRRRRTGARSAAGPLKIIAEGDSWFDYPYPGFGGGVIDRLQAKLGVPILNLAKAGDEVRYMLGVQQREAITKRLIDGSPTGDRWDVMLFSGGGNDIVGEPMALWIEEYKSSLAAHTLINQPRFEAALAIVKAGYEDLIKIRDDYSPNTYIVFHGYDFAIPDGRGVCFYGPWLKPTFMHRKFPANLKVATEVVEVMLRQFAQVLKYIEDENEGVTFINTQGTLRRDVASWHNELHPSAEGFDKFAGLFAQDLKALFPNRLPR